MLEQMTHLLLLANLEQRLLLAPEKTVDNFPYECDYYLIEFARRTYTGETGTGWSSRYMYIHHWACSGGCPF